MAYTPTIWKDDEAPAISADNLNKLEQGVAEASAPVSYNDLTNKPTLLTIGTTAATAKAGNYVPTWSEVSGKPTTYAPVIGTTATTALAGNTPLLQIGTTATTAKAGNWTPPNVTTTVAGLMIAADKVKLDGLTGKTVVPTAAPTIAIPDPVDDESVQAAFDALIQKLKDAGVFT